MIMNLWLAIGPALANHLWQSTLFAITPGLLTWPLRSNCARVRYWFWQAASIKFLLPFFPLVWLGNSQAMPRTPASTNEGFCVALEQVSHPFIPTTMPARQAVSQSMIHVLSYLLATRRYSEKLGFGRKLLVATIAAASIAGPVILGLVGAPRVRAQLPSATGPITITYDVASIKPDHSDGHHIHISGNANSLTASGVTLKHLVEFAYNINDSELSGGPDWIDSETYELQAKMDESTMEALNKFPVEQREEQRRGMLQSLLAERFNLKVSHVIKELPIFALELATKGPKFPESTTSDITKAGLSVHDGDLTAKGLPMSRFAEWLSGVVGRKVVDKTGLQGKYDFTLNYDNRRPAAVAINPAEPSLGTTVPPTDSPRPSIFTALHKQLGLKLQSQKGPVETLVIDSVEKPSEN
jgi:bla regulator protein blaR1